MKKRRIVEYQGAYIIEIFEATYEEWDKDLTMTHWNHDTTGRWGLIGLSEKEQKEQDKADKLKSDKIYGDNILRCTSDFKTLEKAEEALLFREGKEAESDLRSAKHQAAMDEYDANKKIILTR